jgi:hypothetical protein
MGSNQSTEVNAVTDVLMQETTNIMTKNGQNASSSIITVQKIDVIIDKIKGCSVSINSSVNVTQDMKAVVSLQTTADIKNTMEAAIQNTMASTQKTVQSFLASALANENSSTNITNKIHQAITDNVTTENTTDIQTAIRSIQKGKYKFGEVDCEGKAFVITQDMIIKQVTTMIVKSALSALNTISEFAEAANKSTTDQTTTQKGVAEAIGAFGLAILTPLLLIGGVVILPNLMKGGGGKALPGVPGVPGGKGGLNLGNIASTIEKNPELLAFRSGSGRRSMRLKCCDN